MKTSKLIFYLDDDIDDLKFFKQVVNKLGHEVATFLDGREMLYALKHITLKPDIIFLDIHMPILNGEEILNVIRKNNDYKYIPIVMISGAYPKKLVRSYLEAGANHMMKKTGISDLKIAVEEILKMDFNFPISA